MAEMVKINDSIVKDEVRTFDWEDKVVEVKRFLPLEDAMYYVNSVVNGCLDDENNYIPEGLDFMRRYQFVKCFTNIELPDNTSAAYKVLYGTELYDMVYELVELDQLDVLWTAINERINMIKNDKKSIVEKQLADMYAMVKNVSDVLGETIGDVTGEQITDFLKALANNQVDEEKIVSALLEEKKKRESAAN